MLSSEEKKAIIDLFPFIEGSPIVFDCGSNKGHFSELILSEFKDNCQLHLFEPIKMLLDYTRIRFEYNLNITYNQLGVMKNIEETPFFYFENYNNEISSVFPDKEEWKELPMKEGKIQTISIDKYCKDKKIDNIHFLKLDIEGSEVSAINGCVGMLKADKIKIIQIEYGGHYKRANTKFQEVIDLVTPLGYRVYKYVEDNFYELKDFKEDYAAQNYYITKEEIHNYSVGWGSEFILNTIELPKFDFCLEVGAFEGLTSKYIAEKMLNEGGRVAVVDPLLEYYIEGDTEHPYFRGQYQRFKRNTRGLAVELFRGKSEVELPKMYALRYDFIYVDGDHRKDAVYFDLSWCFGVCKIEGYILVDDYTWRPETTEGIDKFLNEFAGSLEIIRKDYQVLFKKTANQYNELTSEYYK